MLSDAEEIGAISPGKIILVDPTTGNTALGIAFVAATKGYKLIVTMPASINVERRILLRAFGAKIHFQTTWPEIWEDTMGNVDVLVARIGTGGTVTGIGRYLKMMNKNIKV
ncbi:putative S-sulfocysteine synthase, chloroplastic [Glycine max]|nr:putative S-sulfocysteine synthase, chloroplastic [Glycine max]